MVLAAGAAAGCLSEREAAAPNVGVCNLPVGAGVPGSTIIVIQQLAFAPAEIRLRAGERVTWVNCETQNLSHTSTAVAGEWASPLLAPGDAFTHTFASAGEFAYFCEPHPFMTGRIVVE